MEKQHTQNGPHWSSVYLLYFLQQKGDYATYTILQKLSILIHLISM